MDGFDILLLGGAPAAILVGVQAQLARGRLGVAWAALALGMMAAGWLLLSAALEVREPGFMAVRYTGAVLAGFVIGGVWLVLAAVVATLPSRRPEGRRTA